MNTAHDKCAGSGFDAETGALAASTTDLVGGRSGTYESELRKAKDFAIAQMVEDAGNFGADAVVGVDLDYEHLGGGNRSMLMVTANGTAVRLR